MPEAIMITELISKVNSGHIRIPSFQRGFVWDADKVAHLMDSMYKGFPFGSLLFWRTKTPLKSEKRLGPFELPNIDPDYPLDYVLDGQQRATSIFGVFQSKLTPIEGEDDSAFKIYFDLTQESLIQDSNFFYLADEDVDSEKHFPLRLLFNPPEYRKYLRELPELIAERVDALYEKFTTARIPIQTFETDDRASVAIVFERINRMGVELDTLQLLSAWTWSEDFDLQEEFSDLAEELEPFGFKDVGKDSDLLLRCCSAIITKDASPNAIIDLKGDAVRGRFAEIKKGIFGAIDFLKHNCHTKTSALLPFATILIPLSVFFATPNEQDTSPTDEQRNVLLKWIWRTFFSRRYSKRLEQLNGDIKLVELLKTSGKSDLGNFSVTVDSKFFTDNQFVTSTVNTKTFVLMLANAGPLSFISGAPVVLDTVLRESNKKEFHHIYPRKFLANNGFCANKINSLVNFAIISRADNNALSGDAPSIYKSKMPQDPSKLAGIIGKSIVPDSIFTDDFNVFSNDRAAMLVSWANKLMQI